MSERRKAERRVTLFGSGRHRAENPINNSSRRNTRDRRQAELVTPSEDAMTGLIDELTWYVTDYDGTQLHDDAQPRGLVLCSLLRKAATALSSLAADNERLTKTSFERTHALVNDVLADRYGKPLVAALHLCLDLEESAHAANSRADLAEKANGELRARLTDLLTELDKLKGAPWLGGGLALSNAMTTAAISLTPTTDKDSDDGK